MAFLKSDFEQAIRDAVATRPAAATAYRAGDPRLLAQIEASAAMLAMLSQQIDVAESEPFVKGRDGTVLADAALKGILPLARPAKMQVRIVNPGPTPVTLAAGRSIVDGKGRRYVIEGSATAPAAVTVGLVTTPGVANITALQTSVRTVAHTVTNSQPFYALLVPESPDGLLTAGLEVSDAVGAYTYTVDFSNVAPGARIFHAETDEYRRLWVRFGAAQGGAQIYGYQPPTGTAITVRVTECEGEIELAAGSAFALEYIGNTAEGLLRLELNEILATGAAPATIEVLRMLSRYAALHDSSAVFLSDFTFLLRRHLAGVEFLSVWNEQIEEDVRGPNVLNINKLFVAFSIPSQTTGVSQDQIRRIVARADDSYQVEFIARNDIPVPVTVTAVVAAVHDTGDVEAQIRAVVLAEYGRGSVAASQGLQKTYRVQRLHDSLRKGVPALQDQISDFSILVGVTPDPLPEDFRFISDASLTVTVSRLESASGLWSV